MVRVSRRPGWSGTSQTVGCASSKRRIMARRVESRGPLGLKVDALDIRMPGVTRL